MAISVDTLPEARGITSKHKVPFPILTDPGMVAIRAWGVAMVGQDIAVPSTFVVNRAGKITWKKVGELPADRPSVDEILAAVQAAASGP